MSRSEHVGVLMTCVGGTLSSELLRSLRTQSEVPLRLIGVDSDERVGADQLVEPFERVPPGSDPRFIPSLLDICTRYRIRVLIPGADEEVEAIADARSLFEERGVFCIVPDAETVRMLRNKARLMQALQRCNITVAAYQEVLTHDDVRQAAAVLGYPQEPFVLKPCAARGGRGALIVDARVRDNQGLLTNREEMRLCLEDVCWLLRDAQRQPLLAMAYLPGDAYDVDLLCDHGSVLCLSIRRRYNKRGIPFRGCVTERHELIEQKVRAIAAALHLHACLDIDMALSADGQPHVLEINPRLSGSVVGSIAAGMNVALEAIRMALGLPIVGRVSQPGIETLPVTSVQVRRISQTPPTVKQSQNAPDYSVSTSTRL